MRSRRGVAVSARASGCKGAGADVCGRDGESGLSPGPLSASSRGRSRVAHPYPPGRAPRAWLGAPGHKELRSAARRRVWPQLGRG